MEERPKERRNLRNQASGNALKEDTSQEDEQSWSQLIALQIASIQAPHLRDQRRCNLTAIIKSGDILGLRRSAPTCHK